MAEPSAEVPTPPAVLDEGSTSGRDPQQEAHEAAAMEVEATLLQVEQAIRRADKARRAARTAGERHFELALTDAIHELEQSRKRLFQATYVARDQQRLL